PALFAAHRAADGDRLELALQPVNALAEPAPIFLELGLAGSAAADAAGQTAHRVSFAAQPRQTIAELRQLDLQLAVAALRALREDVEDQLRAVDDLELGRFGNRVQLRRREVLVEDDELGAVLHRSQVELLELAAAEQRARIGPAALQHRVEHGDSRGARELL